MLFRRPPPPKAKIQRRFNGHGQPKQVYFAIAYIQINIERVRRKMPVRQSPKEHEKFLWHRVYLTQDSTQRPVLSAANTGPRTTETAPSFDLGLFWYLRRNSNRSRQGKNSLALWTKYAVCPCRRACQVRGRHPAVPPCLGCLSLGVDRGAIWVAGAQLPSFTEAVTASFLPACKCRAPYPPPVLHSSSGKLVFRHLAQK